MKVSGEGQRTADTLEPRARAFGGQRDRSHGIQRATIDDVNPDREWFSGVMEQSKRRLTGSDGYKTDIANFVWESRPNDRARLRPSHGAH